MPTIGMGIQQKSKKSKQRRVLQQVDLANVLECLVEAVLVTDAEGVVQFANPALQHDSGYSEAELVGKTLRFFESTHHSPEFYEDMWETIQMGKVWRDHCMIHRKDGTLFHKDVTISPVRNERGEISNYSVFLRDVTEQVAHETHTIQVQKLEAIGRLAGGVAHDFNNLLSIIINYTQFVEEAVSGNKAAEEDLREIQRAAKSAADLTRQLLVFGRKESIQPKVLDLNEVITKTDKLLRRSLGADVQLITICKPNLPRIKADPGRLEQVFINLSINARDAMPRGGKLIVETSEVELDEAYARNRIGVKPGKYVLVTVSDTGHGMTREVAGRIFEPFFSTKEKNKGTGLGLAMVYGIVKRAGGNIWVYSEPNIGTTFKVYFPVADVAADRVSIEGKEPIPRRGKNETILVAEDEEAVRKMIRRILCNYGYQVLDAKDGVEALELAKAHQDSIDLLLTDVVMPKMSGKELADEFCKQNDPSRVLFMSGYANSMLAHQDILDKDVRFIQKPFTENGLLISIQTALDAAAEELEQH